jgi:hypothetical protein
MAAPPPLIKTTAERFAELGADEGNPDYLS